MTDFTPAGSDRTIDDAGERCSDLPPSGNLAVAHQGAAVSAGRTESS